MERKFTPELVQAAKSVLRETADMGITLDTYKQFEPPTGYRGRENPAFVAIVMAMGILAADESTICRV